MSGAWVNTNSYSPGKRHFYPDGAERVDAGEDVRRDYRYEKYVDQTLGRSLCGQRPLTESGYVCFTPSGKRSHSWGGLSIKEKVNLLQRNLCSRCLKQYIADRPALREAVEAVQKAQVMSE